MYPVCGLPQQEAVTVTIGPVGEKLVKYDCIQAMNWDLATGNPTDALLAELEILK